MKVNVGNVSEGGGDRQVAEIRATKHTGHLGPVLEIDGNVRGLAQRHLHESVPLACPSPWMRQTLVYHGHLPFRDGIVVRVRIVGFSTSAAVELHIFTRRQEKKMVVKITNQKKYI